MGCSWMCVCVGFVRNIAECAYLVSSLDDHKYNNPETLKP